MRQDERQDEHWPHLYAINDPEAPTFINLADVPRAHPAIRLHSLVGILFVYPFPSVALDRLGYPMTDRPL
jgi:hypothetical protein